MAKTRRKKRSSFSRVLIAQESALIWILTISGMALAYVCVLRDYLGPLPWLGITMSCAWAAYGVSQAAYYKKSKAENTVGGIVYETAVNRDIDCE